MTTSAHALITDHIGYWALDETTGTTADDAYTGTPDDGALYNGETANTHGPTWTTAGKVGGALTFDGSNDNVRIGDSGYGPSFTVAFWFKVSNNTGGHGTLFSHGTAYTNNSLMIRMAGSNNGSIWTYLCDGTDSGCATGEGTAGNWADGTWHHYALVVSSTTDDGKIYLDGVLTDTFAKGGDTINPSGLIHVGRRNDGDYPLRGSMDELRLFNRALSATEVGELRDYTTTPPVPEDHIGYWKLDETSGNTAADQYTITPDSGTRYDGSTVGAGPAWSAGKVIGGLAFDGVDDNLQIGDSGYGPDFSVAFWFKATDVSGAHGTLFSHGTAYAANSLMIRIAGGGSGSIWTYLCDGTDTGCSTGAGTSGAGYGDGLWHHYILTVGATDNTSKIYIDGQLKVNVPKGGGAINPSGLVFSGRRNDGQYPFKGSMDEIRLYDRELSAGEVTALFGYPDGVDVDSPSDVALTSPASGATVTATITITATATDDQGVAGVTFFRDAVQIGAEDTTSPYNVAWNTTTVTDNAYSLTAVARDAAGNQTTSLPVTVIVDNPSGGEIGMVTKSDWVDSTTVDLLNPERGWYHGVNVPHTGHIENVRALNMTLALMVVDLRTEFEYYGSSVYSSATLPAGLVTAIRTALQDARDNGFKLIVRFRYRKKEGYYKHPTTNVVTCSYDDPSLTNVEGHIEGMRQTFEDYKDVIALVQAGWVGSWGEFNQYCPAHLIQNGQWDEVIDKALDVIPDQRMLAIRTPDRKDDYLDGTGDDDFMAATEAFSGTARARTAHFNDCILVSTSDQGTYNSTAWHDYVEEESRYTPWGGETCPLSDSNGDPYASALQVCDNAEVVLANRHMSYLNSQYTGVVIDDDANGLWYREQCRDTFTKYMGYRFSLDSTQHSASVRKGERLILTVQLTNHGLASMYNERPVYVVLKSSDGVTRYKAKLTGADVDPRLWIPEGGPTAFTFTKTVKLPADARETTYTLALWMPEDISSMPATSTYINVRNDPEHAVELATSGVWQSSTGYNALATNFVIGPGAAPNPGEGDATFTACTDCP